MSTTEGIAPEASPFLAQKLSAKLDKSYLNIMGYIRKKLRFELLKTTLMAVRGFRKNRNVKMSELDLNLIDFYVK